MKIKNTLFALTLGAVLAACAAEDTAPTMEEQAEAIHRAKLDTVLDVQPDERKARYGARHPGETLEFFGITPGMTVVEVLPGRGWYSPILAAYLGPDGKLIGVDYPLAVWSNFSFATLQFVASTYTCPEVFI